MKYPAFTYIGPSMQPTFHGGDGLIVALYNERLIKKGDVVVFLSPLNGERVVHRVVAITPHGIRTRGDNNRLDDPWLLQPADIIGRVIEIHRGNRRLKSWNGLAGHQRAQLQRTQRHFLYRIVTLWPQWLPKRLPFIRPRHLKIAVFKKTGAEEQILMLGRRAIGRRRDAAAPWIIRAPYRFFISTATVHEIDRHSGTSEDDKNATAQR